MAAQRMHAAARGVVSTALDALLRNPQFTGRTFLGLDVSSRAVGMGVVNAGGVLLESSLVTAKAGDHIFTIGAAVGEQVSELHKNFDFTSVGIEDFLRSFATGRFNTQGLFKLARLNGIISYECWRRTDGPVSLHVPMSIRAYFGLKPVADAIAALVAQRPETTATDVMRACGLDLADADAAAAADDEDDGDAAAGGDGDNDDDASGSGSEDADDGAVVAAAPAPVKRGKQPAAAAPAKKARRSAKKPAGGAAAASAGGRPLEASEVTKLASLLYVTCSLDEHLAASWSIGRTGSLQATNYDRADALLVAMYTACRGIERHLLGDLPLVAKVALATQPGLAPPPGYFTGSGAGASGLVATGGGGIAGCVGTTRAAVAAADATPAGRLSRLLRAHSSRMGDDLRAMGQEDPSVEAAVKAAEGAGGGYAAMVAAERRARAALAEQSPAVDAAVDEALAWYAAQVAAASAAAAAPAGPSAAAGAAAGKGKRGRAAAASSPSATASPSKAAASAAASVDSLRDTFSEVVRGALVQQPGGAAAAPAAAAAAAASGTAPDRRVDVLPLWRPYRRNGSLARLMTLAGMDAGSAAAAAGGGGGGVQAPMR